jgi:hypothetical protein
MDKYDVYCDFDLEKHKETYVNYLEVMIDKDGKIMYAVPSHQEKAIEMACESKGVDRAELSKLCPKEYYFDFLTWLLMQSGAMAVWNEYYQSYNVTRAQYASLRRLKLAGVYKGALPAHMKVG